MLLRPRLRVIMAAAITGRDSTAHSALRGPTAAWRAMRRRTSGSDGDLSRISTAPPDDQDGNEESPVTAVLTDRPNVLRPEMKSTTVVPAALIKTTASQ
jgi:hypothetical protein